MNEEPWRRQLREAAEKLLAERNQKRLEEELEDAAQWEDTLYPEIGNESISK